jgi:glycosyltransferase involved in cell wall biosynthesis
MRVLFCNKYNYPFSGTEVYLFDLMAMLRAHGHETALFSMADERGAKTEFDGYLMPPVDFKAAGLSPWKQAEMAGRAIYSREARVRLGRLIQEFRPDVAHVRNIYHHLSPSVLWELRAQRVPVIYHLNDFKLLCPNYNFVNKGEVCQRCRQGQYWRVLAEGCHPSPRGSAMALVAEAYLHRWMKTYDRCVDQFIAPTEFVKKQLVNEGWDPTRIQVLYHFQRLAESELTRPQADAPVLYFGRLSEEKGLRDLVRAMKRVNRARLVIAGDGPLRTELESMVRECGLGNVEFAGKWGGTVLERCIRESAFTVFPSRVFETLGKTILESYAMGRAVIASDLGSRREMVTNGRTGLLYAPADVEQLAGAISFLYQRPELAAQMGTAGRELVRTRHQPESHYEAIMRIYEEVIERKAAATPERANGPTFSQARPRLRISFIGGRGVGSSYSGIEQYYEEVGKRLAARGHEMIVYCRGYFTPKQAGPDYNGMRLVRLPTFRSKHLDTFVHTLLSTVHATFGRSQIVHYHALGPALFSFLPRLVGKKTVVTVQGLDWQRKKWGRLAAWVLRMGERAAVLSPNRTMVVSQALREYYQHRYGTTPLYVPNGTHLRPRPEPSCILKWGLAPGQYILFLGRFSPEKNLHLLIQAFERIETPVKLVLAGGSSYSNQYVRELRRHESDRVRVLDWLAGEPLDELLAHAMLFVLPSDLEGLSLALLDAMAAGLCVLTSDVPENRELVEGAGFTFRRGEVADLERMLRLLIADPEIRRQAGISARDRVREHYLWPDIVEQIEQCYLDSLGWKGDARSREESQEREKHILEEKNIHAA